jgi:hypothetical protein
VIANSTENMAPFYRTSRPRNQGESNFRLNVLSICKPDCLIFVFPRNILKSKDRELVVLSDSPFVPRIDLCVMQLESVYKFGLAAHDCTSEEIRIRCVQRGKQVAQSSY